MAIRKFDVVLPGGFEVRNLNTVEDVERFTQLVADRHFQELVRLSASKPVHSNGAGLSQKSPLLSNEAKASPAKTKPFSDCVALYLAEKKHDNSAKTLLEKQSTLEEFQRFFGDLDLISHMPSTTGCF